MRKKTIDSADYIGRKFNRLTILKEVEPSVYGKVKTRNVLCRCDCGVEKIIDFSSILHGRSSSCGCYGRQWSKEHATKHGLGMISTRVKRPEYTTWLRMKSRCNNPNNPDYKHYGGRGISISPEWLTSFENFINDMGWKPFKGASIERIDVNGNYCKENCKWVSMRDQHINTRRTIRVDYDGKLYCLTELCKKLNISYDMIRHRMIDLKLSFEESLKYPKGYRFEELHKKLRNDGNI